MKIKTMLQSHKHFGRKLNGHKQFLFPGLSMAEAYSYKKKTNFKVCSAAAFCQTLFLENTGYSPHCHSMCSIITCMKTSSTNGSMLNPASVRHGAITHRQHITSHPSGPISTSSSTINQNADRAPKNRLQSDVTNVCSYDWKMRRPRWFN